MRKVASYAFTSKVIPPDRVREHHKKILSIAKDWINKKGTIADGGKRIIYQDKRVADFSVDQISSEKGSYVRYEIREPIDTGEFVTSCGVAFTNSEISIYATLLASSAYDKLAPIEVDARCPQIIRDIIDLNVPWFAGNTKIQTFPQLFKEPESTNSLLTITRDPRRSLPLIVISELDGATLHPGIDTSIARDLCGLAVVAQISKEVALEITRQYGKEWSCYNGAIRLFWPFSKNERDYKRHPLWTMQKLLNASRDSKDAEERIRALFRRKLFGISSFTIHEPYVFEEIRRADLRARIEKWNAQRKSEKDFEKLAEEYARENDNLQKEVTRQGDIIDQLRTDLYQAQSRVAWQASTYDEVEPDYDEPPATVSEAVDRARKIFQTDITFGDEVEIGVSTLANDAGPPDKIFDYLEYLSLLAQERRKGSLGKSLIAWLNDQGLSASIESETTRNNNDEMSKRIWHDGRSKRQFDLHLKPSDATSPERCVRIYFDWDDVVSKIVIGWIGRHP